MIVRITEGKMISIWEITFSDGTKQEYRASTMFELWYSFIHLRGSLEIEKIVSVKKL
jgi:hypothetical protein